MDLRSRSSDVSAQLFSLNPMPYHSNVDRAHTPMTSGARTFNPSSFLGLIIALCFISSTFAEERSRLAVLELQGELGSISQKQTWSDTMRAEAIELLKGREILVIDRAQFQTLINPKKSLRDCVGLCEAQIAREVGARWSLSARISADIPPEPSTHVKGRPSLKSGPLYTLTLKLHRVDGSLLKIAQKSQLKLQGVTEAIRLNTREALSPLCQPVEPSSVNARTPIEDPPSSYERAEGAPLEPLPTKLKPTRWRFVPHLKNPKHGLCVSETITYGHYLECVQMGTCSPATLLGRCNQGGQLNARLGCIDVAQAATFAKELGGRLPSSREWRMIQTLCPECMSERGGRPSFEWVLDAQTQRVTSPKTLSSRRLGARHADRKLRRARLRAQQPKASLSSKWSFRKMRASRRAHRATEAQYDDPISQREHKLMLMNKALSERSRRALRVGKKLKVLGFDERDRLAERSLPPAFRVADVGVRVVYLSDDPTQCVPLD